jgi:hypothetical protein
VVTLGDVLAGRSAARRSPQDLVVVVGPRRCWGLGFRVWGLGFRRIVCALLRPATSSARAGKPLFFQVNA